MTRVGAGASYRQILTVAGRRTGRLYSTPVDVLEVGGERWLVAGYGPASWVRNVRASGQVTLRRGRRSAKFEVDEADERTAVPVLPTSRRSASRAPTSTLAPIRRTQKLLPTFRGTPSFD
jgi:deazaflavin-dependent oxidoreductase (nitroreductase family)